MNNRGFFKMLGVTVTVFLVAALALQATAAEVTPHTRQQLQWVWSETSADINKATSALASGHTARALRLARTVMTHAPTSADRLIAVHNLCIAHLAQGDITAADTHCRAALLASDSTHVISRRGALVAVTTPAGGLRDDSSSTLKLVTVLRANVAQAYGTAVADNFTSSVEAAAW